jgi:hypothetical protein
VQIKKENIVWDADKNTLNVFIQRAAVNKAMLIKKISNCQ